MSQGRPESTGPMGASRSAELAPRSGMTEDESGPSEPSSSSSARPGSERAETSSAATPRAAGQDRRGVVMVLLVLRPAGVDDGVVGRTRQRTRSMMVRMPSSRSATDSRTSLRNWFIVVSKAPAPLST